MSDYTDSPEGQYELGRAEYEERCRDREIDALRAEVATAHAAGFREGVEAVLHICREKQLDWKGRDAHEVKVWKNVEQIILDELPPPPPAPAPAKDGEAP